ncbi:MAG: M6 family metalloprotease domain-containing protein [Candidatus Cloacimonetes bacterium]|nr:M6 family metalloprotease domain-containing protein [Candidatus Cloacimonadota bacterium]
MITTKKCVLLLVLALATLVNTSLQAAYLTNMPATITQPDGTKIECLASGDEYHNWLHDKDNYTIIRSPKNGYYYYAEKSGEEVIAGTAIVGKDLPQSRGLTPSVNISETAYKAMRNTKFYMPQTRNAPTIGTINNIVIYIRFSDETEFGDSNSLYDGWLNSNTNSLKNYYQEASYNKLTVNTTFYPASSNGFVVSWQDSHARAYFQPYDATSNPTGYNGDTERRTREFTLLQNATNGVASQIPTGLNIDSDNDGRVDNVVFIIRGTAGAWSSLLWPHRWAIYDRTVTLNGKRVYDFNFQLQTFLSSSSVGVLCHEFFHTLGAPDLYHYTSNGISPAGSWDIMQSDQNPPQHMGAYMKWKYGKWINNITTISTDRQYSLLPITSSAGNCYRINSTNPNQYYVVEFRKKTGTFESSIPGSGLLVYRIDTSAGDGNADGPPDEVYIYRPGGTTTVNGTVDSANFSTEVGRTRINSSTNPAPFLQDGSAGNLSLYNIGSSAGSTISFNKGTPPIVTIDFATNPHVEGFDAVTFPPDGWDNQAVVGTKVWERVTTGGSPTCSPQFGAGMLRYNSYSATSGNSAYLASPRIDYNNISNYSYNFAFYMYRDTGYSTKAERVEVYLNTSQNLSGSPTLLGTVNRSTTLAPTVSSTGWYQYAYNLALPSAGYYYIVLKAISAFGNNMFLDSFSFTRTLVPPNAAINPSPAAGSSGQNFTQVLTWQSGGGNPTAYKLYLGTNNPPTNLVNGTNLGNVLSYAHAGGIPLSSTIYWKIVPTGDGGDASNCPVWSFSTIADTSVFPFEESFGTSGASFPPNYWTRYSGQLAEPSVLAANTSYWIQDDWTNIVAAPQNFSARMNIYGTNRFGWLISPLLKIPANAMLEFDLALTDWNNSNAISSDPNGASGVDDQFAVLISDGSSWASANLIRKWDNAGSAYVYNNIAYSGKKVYLDLAAYPGYKYIAFYGASTTSNADNDLFVDNVSVKLKPANAVLNLAPVAWDAGTKELNSQTNQVFTIQNGGTSSLSISSISLSGSSAFSLQGLPSLPISLSFGQSTTFSVQFMPTSIGTQTATVNVSGSNPASISLAGLGVDTRIATMPFSESFDTITTPSLPLGWRAYVNSTSTSAYVQSSTTYPQSSPHSVSLSNSSDAAADVRLITPEIMLPVNSLKLKLSARGNSAGYQLLIGTVSSADGSGVFTQIGVLDLTSDHTEYVVSFAAYAGTDSYIAIKHGLGGTSRSIHIDDFRLEEILNNDLAINALSGLGLGIVGESMSHQVSVSNNGLITQNSYTVKLMAEDRRSELSSLQVNTPLAPNETVTHTLNWVPITADNYSVYALLVLDGDGNLVNNISSTSTATVHPEDTYLPIAGDDNSELAANALPISFYWKNSLSETIYLAEELKMASGNISGLVYKSNFVQELADKPIKIWVKNTSETDLSLGWSGFADYTLVFDGVLTFPIGTNLINIPFSIPFAYNGANLAVRVNRPMDTEYFSTDNHFYYNDAPDYPNRSRYVLSDTTVYDPTDPSAAGTLSSNVPVTVFVVDNAVLATPSITIQQQGADLLLSWNAVPGAVMYRFYASSSPDITMDAPLAVTSELSIAVPISAAMFFKVVATSEEQ